MKIHRCCFVDYSSHTITSTSFSNKSSPDEIKSKSLKLAVGRANGDIEIWTPKFNWKHLFTLKGVRNSSIEGLCWALDKNKKGTLRLFSIDGTVYITEWSLKTLRPINVFNCNSGNIMCIDINEENDKLVVGCENGSVVTINISDGFGFMGFESKLQKQKSRVLCVKWFKNNLIFGGCGDGKIKAWSVTENDYGQIKTVLKVDKSEHESTLIWSLCVLPKKNQLVSGDSTGSVKFWDIENFVLLQSFKNIGADVLSIVSDYMEEKIFSAGVDRKIYQFSLINTKKKFNWIFNFNRLLHSNDIRSLLIFENKRHNFLLSGGVEQSIVVQSVNNFYNGNYRTLCSFKRSNNILFVSIHKLLILWSDHHIKIWKFINNNFKLIFRLVLKDDENIACVALNVEGNLLAVSTLTSIKVFFLLHNENDINVKKLKKLDSSRFKDGAKFLKWYSHDKLVLVTSEDKIIKIIVNLSDGNYSFDGEIKTKLSSSLNDSINTYIHSINNFVLSPNNSLITLSRFDGSIEVYSLSDDLDLLFVLIKLSSTPHLIGFNGNKELIVITDENKIYIFYILNDDSTNLLTPWSKRNSDFLPSEFLSLEDKPYDFFFQDKKIWIYSKSWIAFFDLSLDIPIEKINKNNLLSTKKKKRFLSLNDHSDVDDSFDPTTESIHSKTDHFNFSYKQGLLHDLRSNNYLNNNDKSLEMDIEHQSDKNFFGITKKFDSIIKADLFDKNNVILIEENKLLIKKTQSFNLRKLRF